MESAVQATAWAVGGLLVLTGLAAVAGGVVAALSVGAALAGILVRTVLRRRHPAAGDSPRPATPRPWPGATGVPRRPVPPSCDGTAAGRPGSSVDEACILSPVAELTTRELGREWTRTTVVLAGRLGPAVQESLVQRRGEVLDEPERRDLVGFGRWLAAEPDSDGDPAEYVRGTPRLGGPPAETDAA